MLLYCISALMAVFLPKSVIFPHFFRRKSLQNQNIDPRKMKVTIVMLVLVAYAAAKPAPQLPPGISAAECPNYPFCGAGPSAATAHSEAERQLIALQQQQASSPAFTGLVGPSGSIGPSGLVGPSGNIAF
jgi:hypothetical protein